MRLNKPNKASTFALALLALACAQPAWAGASEASSVPSASSAPSSPSAPKAPAPNAVAPESWARTQCVAALEVQAEATAARIKSGQAGLEAELRATLRAGAAFIGQAYLDGERDEEKSKALLDEARLELRKLPAVEVATRQTSCAEQARQLLADANPFSRMIVSRVADKRMKKMLGP